MSHLTLGSIILGSAVGFPSSEKIANTIFTRKEVQEEIEQKIAEDKEREEREFLWKYIYSDNTSSYICDFWIKSEERGKKKKSIDCEKLFSESINLKKKEKSFFWGEKKEEYIDKLLKSGILEFFNFQKLNKKVVKDHKRIQKLLNSCSKTFKKGKKKVMTILCQN